MQFEARISEIFLSVQGEGADAGFPCVFVRFHGCHVGCPFCDTKQNKDAYTSMEVDQILDVVHSLTKDTKVDRVCITGGEPFEQSDALEKLIHVLGKHGWEVSIETSGTVPVDEGRVASILKRGDHKLTLSPKRPNVPLDYLKAADQIKFLVGAEPSEDDKLYTKTMQYIVSQQLVRLIQASVCFQPIDYGPFQPEKNRAAINRAFEMCCRHNARMSCQIHKHLGMR